MTGGGYCVRVSPRALLRLVEDDLAMGVETVRRSQSCNTGADDGDPHLRRNPPRRPQLLPTV